MTVTQTTSQDKKLSYIKALVWGKSGVGKTTSILTLPQDKTVVVALERSLLPLRHKQYETWKVGSFEDMRDAYRLATKLDGDKSVIVVDSLTEINELAKEHIVRTRRPQLLKSQDKKLVGIYDEMMSQQDWGLLDRLMRGLLSAWVQLPCNIIFTALEAWTKNEDTGGLIRTPGMNGKLAQHCAAFFDLVLYMRAEDTDDKPHRVWQTYADTETIAKDASGALNQVEEANWTKVFRKIRNSTPKTKGGKS